MSEEKKVEEKMINEITTSLIHEEIIESPIDLLQKLAIAEENYRNEESTYLYEYNDSLINTNWDEINKERVEKGLPKLSNQDMKKAYIETDLRKMNEDKIIAKLEYNRLLRMYEMMKKYSLDILR